MNAEFIIKLSAFLSKVGIDLSTISGKTNEEVGNILISQVLNNLYKAENEFYELIAFYKKTTVEEAKKEDIIKLIKELKNVDGIKDFLAQS